MKRIAWCTDIHLNFAKPDSLAEFLHRLRDADPDLLLVGGDIAEATDVVHYLEVLDRHLTRPIYFVLGNHDFYFGSIHRVRQDVRASCARSDNLVYLTDAGVIELSDRVGLVGHDGWADARIGNYERSMIMMNDYRLIEELAGVTKEDRWPLLQALGDAAAADVRRVLPLASSDTSSSTSSRMCRLCVKRVGTKGKFPMTNGRRTSRARPWETRCWRSCKTTRSGN